MERVRPKQLTSEKGRASQLICPCWTKDEDVLLLSSVSPVQVAKGYPGWTLGNSGDLGPQQRTGKGKTVLGDSAIHSLRI